MPSLGSGDFEVHVAVVIFRAGDVGQDGVVVAFLHQSHGDAGDRSLQRNAGIHQRQRGAADRSHRGRTVRFQNVGDYAHRVGPLVFVGQDGGDGTLRQRAMADFAAAGAAQKRNFTNRERREVVVQHEALLGFAFEDFQALHVVAGAEGGGDQGLGFAAGEDGGAVGAGQNADFDPDIADLVEGAAVGTALLIDHLFAEDALAQSLEVGLEFLLGRFVVFRNGGLQLFLEFLDQGVAFRLGMLLGVERVGQVGADLASSGRRSRPGRTRAE